jgi:hypothetical protein
MNFPRLREGWGQSKVPEYLLWHSSVPTLLEQKQLVAGIEPDLIRNGLGKQLI